MVDHGSALKYAMKWLAFGTIYHGTCTIVRFKHPRYVLLFVHGRYTHVAVHGAHLRKYLVRSAKNSRPNRFSNQGSLYA